MPVVAKSVPPPATLESENAKLSTVRARKTVSRGETGLAKSRQSDGTIWLVQFLRQRSIDDWHDSRNPMVKADACIPAGLVIVIADAKLQQLCNELGNWWYAIPAEQLAQTFGGV
jgi:hypothetical protein